MNKVKIEVDNYHIWHCFDFYNQIHPVVFWWEYIFLHHYSIDCSYHSHHWSKIIVLTLIYCLSLKKVCRAKSSSERLWLINSQTYTSIIIHIQHVSVSITATHNVQLSTRVEMLYLSARCWETEQLKRLCFRIFVKHTKTGCQYFFYIV